ncbi:hypothetical protein GZ78_26175 [Endozoicomonas numazuensis]|uniref:Uncharacterized protein n=1 Tax=Endozoicomonas numazuensis TaxID=1137799 RepID=A0A081N6N4_9GAMM|nr:hypothetical protein GZ78_26175 [Endozoicomonas numazuensis]
MQTGKVKPETQLHIPLKHFRPHPECSMVSIDNGVKISRWKKCKKWRMKLTTTDWPAANLFGME